jgi:hypothetical protein
MEEDSTLALTRMSVESSPRLSDRRISFQKENSHRRRTSSGLSQVDSYKQQRDSSEHEGISTIL